MQFIFKSKNNRQNRLSAQAIACYWSFCRHCNSTFRKRFNIYSIYYI